jgi:hypothetical protein
MVVRIHRYLLSPGTPKDYSRVAGIILSAPFFPEGSCQLKLIWASFPFQGVE